MISSCLRMAFSTLRTQILICGALLFATQPARAGSFQVTGVTPPAAYSCPSAPGCTTTVTVQGHGFNTALTGCVLTCPIEPQALFGSQPGIITNITDTQITVILPVHPPGTVDVTVVGIDPAGDSTTLPAGFTFLDPAAIPLLDGRTAALLALALAIVGWIMSARPR